MPCDFSGSTADGADYSCRCQTFPRQQGSMGVDYIICCSQFNGCMAQQILLHDAMAVIVTSPCSVVPQDRIYVTTADGVRHSLKSLERKFGIDWEETVRVDTLETKVGSSGSLKRSIQTVLHSTLLCWTVFCINFNCSIVEVHVPSQL